MKIIARDRFGNYTRSFEIAVYQDGVGIRQNTSSCEVQNIHLDFDEIERVAKLARKHRKTAARLEARDNQLLETA